MVPSIFVCRKVKSENGHSSNTKTVGTFEYNKAGIEQALSALFAEVGSEQKPSPTNIWMQLEDNTGCYVFDVFDADYIDVTKTAEQHTKARRRLAVEVARDKREEDDAFLAAINGEPIPTILIRKGEVPAHVKAGYESGLKIAKDIAGIGE